MTQSQAVGKPTAAARENGRLQRLLRKRDRRTGRRRAGYTRLDGGNDRVSSWKVALAQGQPVLSTFFLSDAYLKIASGDTGGVLRPDPAQMSRFSHAVAIIGYGEDQQAFMVKDSRGDSFGVDIGFGSRSYWWLRYDDVRARWLVRESYSIEELNYG